MVIVLLALAGVAAFTLGFAAIALWVPMSRWNWQVWVWQRMSWSVRQRYQSHARHANLEPSQAIFLWLWRWITAILIGLISGWLTLSVGVAACAATLGWLLYGLWIQHRIKTHQTKLTNQLPAFLDLLVLCMSAGMNLQTAVQVVVSNQERNELSELWQGWLLQLRSGASRISAFEMLLERVQATGLRRICVALIQAEQSGAGAAACLAAHSQQLRAAQLLTAEREALKAPVKMLLPLVMCFFPSTFIVLGFSIFINLGEFFD